MEQFMAYLNRMEESLRRESVKLIGEDRRDEGDLTKIRANVYGICKSVVQVLERGKAQKKLAELQNTWESALAAAREHEDVKKAVIEQVKLETLGEIKAKLEESFGV